MPQQALRVSAVQGGVPPQYQLGPPPQQPQAQPQQQQQGPPPPSFQLGQQQNVPAQYQFGPPAPQGASPAGAPQPPIVVAEPPAPAPQYPPAKPAAQQEQEQQEIEAEKEEEQKEEVPVHPLSIQVTTDYGHIECLRESPLRAVLTLKAAENFPMPKPCLDLVVLINRSISEEVLWNYKHAIEFLMSQMSPLDRLAVIAFEEDAQVLVPMDSVARSYETITAAWAAVDACAVGNGKSNLCAGLKASLQLIEASAKSRLAVNAVLVLTDVAANHGTTNMDQLVKEAGLSVAQQRRELRISQRLPVDQDYPWTVHTFGYGSHHDPAALSEIAFAGKGVYSFVKEGDLVSNAVADCFGGLASSVAVRVEVAVRPAIGCDLKAVRTAYKNSEYDNGIVIDVGDIHRGEETNILLDLHVHALTGVPVGEQQLVDIHIKYLDLRFTDARAASTRLFTSVDVQRPKEVPKQTPVTVLDLQDARYNAYAAIKASIKQASLSAKERQKAASELGRLASKVETSEVFDAKLAKSIVRDLQTCSSGLRKDATEDYIKVLYTTWHQHGFERSVGRPLDDFYSTSSRAAASLRVGRSLRASLARLLESAKYSDLVIAGNKVHRAVLEVRCPRAIEIGEVHADDAEAFKTVLRFIYTGEYIAQRRGPRERVVDNKFRVLQLAKRLHLDVLVALARRELIAFSKIDMLVVKKALEVGETTVVDTWIWRFVNEPDGRSQVQQEELVHIPALASRVVTELRIKAMKRPAEPELPLREPLSADISSLFNSGLHSDLTLKVLYEGARVEFKVHKCVLFSRCPWFAFKDLSKPLEITIPPRAFRGLLAYLYSEAPPLDVLDSLHIIGNYAHAGIDSIEIAKSIVMNLSPDNAYHAFELASRLGLRGLSRAALDVIEDSFQATTRDYVVATQNQLNDLRHMITALTARVAEIETHGNHVSDDDRD